MTSTLTHEHKDAAIYIAGYIGSFNGLENTLIGLFQKALGGTAEEAYVLLGRVQNVNSRVEIIEDYLKFREPDQQWISKVLPLMQRVREASAYRNRLAHGLYLSNGNKLQIGENLFNTSKRRQRQVRDLPIQELRDEYNRLNALVIDLLRASDLISGQA